MQRVKSKHMGFLWILFSAIFLFNPVIACVDILPDTVGYLFLWIGLYRLADLNEYMEDAMRRAKLLFWLSIVYLVLLRFVQNSIANADPVLMNPYEDRSSTFLFAVIRMLMQWFCLIPLFRSMFSGIDRLADKYGDELLSHERKGRTMGARMARRCTTFVIANSLLSVLPEATTLTSGDENTFSSFDWYDFIFMFRALSVMISLIFSIVWLIFFITYFVRVLRRRAWLERLSVAYGRDVLTQVGMLTVRRYARALLLLSVGVIFTANLRVDGRVMLPGIVFALLAWISFAQLGKSFPERRQCLLPCVILGILSAVHWVLNYVFTVKNQFTLEHSLYDQKAFWQFFAMRILGAAEALATVLLVLYVLQMLVQVAKRHTVVDYATKGSEALSRRATERLHQSFEKRAKIMFPFFGIAAAAGMLDSILQMEYPWIWFIALLFSVVGICLFFSLCHELLEEIRARYLVSDTYKRD